MKTIENGSEGFPYNVMRLVNILFVSTVLVGSLLRVFVFPPDHLQGAFGFVLIGVMIAFMIPYMVSIRALSPTNKNVKGSLVILPIWGGFIVVGVLAQDQGLFVNSFLAVLFLLGALNFFFIKKLQKVFESND